ncbi:MULTISPECIES: DUF975 family protein [unclassified Allofournierella]|uniref:DUF975 family protein n=1 Tax=unclassified Allofournierella TaxID=2633662 RepID=UPI000B396CCF|nr:DUF975 family protein [Fournierella sp. CML151]OUN15357.1 hypothetical protein B5G38_10615 [Gemmiger sp. An87]
MYWSRKLLKSNARNVLRGSYWRVFVACLVCGLLGAGSSSTVNINLPTQLLDLNSLDYDPYWSLIFSILWIVMIAVILLCLAWGIFVGSPMKVAQCRYMMENRCGNPPFSSLFSVFSNKDAYLNVVKTMFLRNLFIFLWSLLCVIPGIYKEYQYYYIPYLLAENPYMSFDRAKELSIAMTDGEKMDIFVLDLSFIGWYLLGAIILIGGIFVNPYAQATYAELYAAARSKAMDTGITGPDELSGFAQY